LETDTSSSLSLSSVNIIRNYWFLCTRSVSVWWIWT